MRVTRYNYKAPAIKRDPSQRMIRNTLAFMGGETVMEQPKRQTTERKKPKKQAESAVSEGNRLWARSKGGRLVRNRRGMATLPGGGRMPIGLAEPFIQDDVGYLPILITAEMLGRTLPVLCLIEAKTDSGVVEEHQQRCIEEMRAVGAIAGVARNLDDCELILQRWRDGR
jgi:hypothetical protein